MENEQNDIIIYSTPDGKTRVSLMTRDGKVWLNQTQISDLFGTSVPNICYHIANILREKELDANSVIKDYLITASDGKNYNVICYSLEMILAIGYRIRSIRGVQFRQWATRHLAEYLVKGFVMDDERLKNPDGRPDYFDELLQRIRDIRSSEKRFYQKLRDLFKLSTDYETQEKATQMFFAETQNKLLYAVTHNTAAEIVSLRADDSKPNMGLTSWKGSIVRKGDIIVAKNYLVEDEIDKLNRLVMLFLESAELRVKDRKCLTLDFWRGNVDNLLSFQGYDILQGNGSISNRDMEKYVKKIYDKFDSKRKQIEAELADAEDLKWLENLQNKIKNKNKE
ncbi:MAG: virulence RhuM family protein [Erysipelotrichaceae bacterium]|nr:virulence RhuM family protein [Erysipelotrichaceae bacterium]